MIITCCAQAAELAVQLEESGERLNLLSAGFLEFSLAVLSSLRV
jgi:hypothetical protein